MKENTAAEFGCKTHYIHQKYPTKFRKKMLKQFAKENRVKQSVSESTAIALYNLAVIALTAIILCTIAVYGALQLLSTYSL